MSRKPTLEELNYVQKEVANKGKKTSVAYMLSFPLGFLGAHLAYLGKTAGAITRSLMTIVIVILIILANSTAVEFLKNPQLTNQIQQNSSAIFIFLIVISIIQILFLIKDVSTISETVSEINLKIEEESQEKLKQARYAEESILKGEVYKEIVEATKNRLIESVEESFKNEIISLEKRVSDIKKDFEEKTLLLEKKNKAVTPSMNVKETHELKNDINLREN